MEVVMRQSHLTMASSHTLAMEHTQVLEVLECNDKPKRSRIWIPERLHFLTLGLKVLMLLGVIVQYYAYSNFYVYFSVFLVCTAS